MEPIIVNYIEISGETFLFDSLPEEKKKEVAEKLQDKMMLPIGYKRTPA